jgi:hypothetical protein
MNGGQDEVTIWASQMQPGGLPAICVRTGAPADRWMRRRFATAPAWTYLLLVLGVFIVGVLPFLIVRAAVSVKATGQLPFARSVAVQLQAFSIVGLMSLMSGVILFVAGAVANSGAVSIVGVILFIVGLALLFVVAARWPRALVRKLPDAPNDRVVVLRRVHPNFAEAVRAQQQAAQSAPWPRPTGAV